MKSLRLLVACLVPVASGFGYFAGLTDYGAGHCNPGYWNNPNLDPWEIAAADDDDGRPGYGDDYDGDGLQDFYGSGEPDYAAVTASPSACWEKCRSVEPETFAIEFVQDMACFCETECVCRSDGTDVFLQDLRVYAPFGTDIPTGTCCDTGYIYEVEYCEGDTKFYLAYCDAPSPDAECAMVSQGYPLNTAACGEEICDGDHDDDLADNCWINTSEEICVDGVIYSTDYMDDCSYVTHEYNSTSGTGLSDECHHDYRRLAQARPSPRRAGKAKTETKHRGLRHLA